MVSNRRALLRVCDVAGDDFDADLAGQFGGQVAQSVFTSGDQGHAVAAVGEFTGDVSADTRGGAGNDGGSRRRGLGQTHSGPFLVGELARGVENWCFSPKARSYYLA